MIRFVHSFTTEDFQDWFTIGTFGIFDVVRWYSFLTGEFEMYSLAPVCFCGPTREILVSNSNTPGHACLKLMRLVHLDHCRSIDAPECNEVDAPMKCVLH